MLTSIDYKVTFDLTAAPKTFIFEDLTDYVSQSVLEADVTGILECTGPDGTVFYQNLNYASPDIDVDVSRLNSTVINIPLLGNGEVEPGNYSFKYSVQDSSDSTIVFLEKTFEFCYVSPNVTVEMSADCVAPNLRSNDTTNYVVENITPTIVRQHTVRFPLGSGEADLVSANKQIDTAIFYTQTNQSEVISNLSYDYGGGIFIQDVVTGTTELDVQCDSSLCDLYCCLYSLYKRWQEALCVNSVEAERLQDRFVQAEAIRNLIKDSLECGKGENVSELTSKVLALGDCEPGCGCADGEPVPVFGLGGSSGSSAITVVDAGTGINVVSNVVGDTTTYTVSIDPAILDLINNATNVAVLAGTGGITVDTNVVSGQTQYTINNTQTQPGMVSVVYNIIIQDAASPSLGVNTENVYGDSRFQSPTLTNTFTVFNDWLSQNTNFLVDGFLDGATNYSVTAQVVNILASKRGQPPTSVPSEPFRIEVFDKTSSEFRFRFVAKTGYSLTGSSLQDYNTIRVSIQIIE
jgi:hypothetical protein